MALLVSIATMRLYCLERYRTINEEQGRSAATMASVMNDYEEEIAERVERGETYVNISRFLQHVLPHSRGLSPRSVRRFCSERGIRFRSNLMLNGGFLSKAENVGLILCSDGVPVYRSSRGSLWPVYLMLTSIKPHTSENERRKYDHCSTLVWP